MKRWLLCMALAVTVTSTAWSQQPAACTGAAQPGGNGGRGGGGGGGVGNVSNNIERSNEVAGVDIDRFIGSSPKTHLFICRTAPVDALDSACRRSLQPGAVRRGAGVSKRSLGCHSPGGNRTPLPRCRRVLLLREERAGHSGRWKNVLGSARRHRDLAPPNVPHRFINTSDKPLDDGHADLDQPGDARYSAWWCVNRLASLLRRERPLEQYLQMYFQRGGRALPERTNVSS